MLCTVFAIFAMGCKFEENIEKIGVIQWKCSNYSHWFFSYLDTR